MAGQEIRVADYRPPRKSPKRRARDARRSAEHRVRTAEIAAQERQAAWLAIPKLTRHDEDELDLRVQQRIVVETTEELNQDRRPWQPERVRS